MSSELFAEKLKRWTSHQTDSNRYVSDEEHAEMIRKLLAISKGGAEALQQQGLPMDQEPRCGAIRERRLQAGEEGRRTGGTSCFKAVRGDS